MAPRRVASVARHLFPMLLLLSFLALQIVLSEASNDASLWNDIADRTSGAVGDVAGRSDRTTHSLDCHGTRSMRKCSGFAKGDDQKDPLTSSLPGDGARCDIDVLPYSEFDPDFFKREYHLHRPVIYSRAIITPPSVKVSMVRKLNSMVDLSDFLGFL